jgi:hypothetical protein
VDRARGERTADRRVRRAPPRARRRWHYLNLLRTIDARWAVAFALGLLHGFGFSSVLVDLGLPSHELIAALLGFNLGVELGQAVIVLALLPVLFWIRRTLAYRALLWAGSGAVALIATSWSYQRCFA